LASKTPAQHQTQLNCEKKLPTKKVDVFLWDWSDEDSEQLVCTRVNMREGEDILSSYPDSQLVYNLYSNVWDACEYFGPDEDSESMVGDAIPVPTALTPAPTPSDPVINDVGTSEQAEHEAFCRDRVRQLNTTLASERFKKLFLSYSLDTDFKLDLTRWMYARIS
jgi:hypothetical protein